MPNVAKLDASTKLPLNQNSAVPNPTHHWSAQGRKTERDGNRTERKQPGPEVPSDMLQLCHLPMAEKSGGEAERFYWDLTGRTLSQSFSCRRGVVGILNAKRDYLKSLRGQVGAAEMRGLVEL